MRKLLTVLAMLALSGCSVLVTDFKAAALLAAKYGDTSAAECFVKVAADLENQAAIQAEPSEGIVTQVEKLRLFRLQMEKNRAALETACGPLVVDALLQAGKGLPGVR